MLQTLEHVNGCKQQATKKDAKPLDAALLKDLEPTPITTFRKQLPWPRLRGSARAAWHGTGRESWQDKNENICCFE